MKGGETVCVHFCRVLLMIYLVGVTRRGVKMGQVVDLN
jgi:hypothetical protein